MRQFFIKIAIWLTTLGEPFECEKEAMGYTCRHGMHGNVPECGAWSKVRGYDNAAS